MKFEPVTIKDIAKALNLSKSTVSRALRDSYEISSETKEIVVAYAKSVNYRPNQIALNLKERRSRTIGIVVSEIANSFFSQIINGIESIAKENDYNVIITQTLESYEREIEVIHNLAQSVDGLLISLSSETKDIAHIQLLHDRGMPIVFFDRIIESIEAHKVISDDYKGAYSATTHLLENGYKKIAFIGNTPNLSIIKHRKEGYLAALQKAGIKPKESYIKYCEHGGMYYEEVEEIINQLFKLKDRPDAVFSCSDKITTNCFRYFNANNIILPDDIALIGFSNLDLTGFMKPSLSIIKQQAFEIGVKAAELLIKQIESKRPVYEYSKIVLDPELFIRDSTQKRKNTQ